MVVHSVGGGFGLSVHPETGKMVIRPTPQRYDGFDPLRGSHSRRSSACGSANHAIAGGGSVGQHVCQVKKLRLRTPLNHCPFLSLPPPPSLLLPPPSTWCSCRDRRG